MMKTRRKILSGASLACLALAGCTSAAGQLNRETLLRSLEPIAPTPVPSVEDLSSLRVPPPIAPSESERREATRIMETRDESSVLARARIAVGMFGDIARAQAEWEDVRVPDGDTKEALLLHRCLVEDSYARYPEMLAACSDYLALAPEKKAAATIAQLIARKSVSIHKASSLVFAMGEGWLSKCRLRRDEKESCADLAYALSTSSRKIAAVRKDEKKAHAFVQMQGAVRRAEVRGPYAGMVAFQHGQEWLPLFSPEEISAQTFTRFRAPWDGDFSPAYRGEKGLYRIQFEAEAKEDVLLLVTSRTALRLEIDGQVALERRPRLRSEPRISRVPVHFAPGRHRFVMWAASYGSGDGISVSALDAEGNPAFQNVGTSFEDARQGDTWRPSTHPGFASEAPKPEGTLADVDAGLVHVHRSIWGNGVSPKDGIQTIRYLLKHHGFAPQVLVHATQRFQRADNVPARLATADVATYRAALAKVWPDHPRMMLDEAKEVWDERPEDAFRQLKRLSTVHPTYQQGLRAYARLATEQGLLDDASLAVERLLDADHSPENLRALIRPMRRLGKVHEASRFERVIARQADELYSQNWSAWLLSRGQRTEAIAELERLANASPGHAAENVLWRIAGRDDPERVLRRMEAIIDAYPLDHETYFQRIDLLSSLGRMSEAKAELRNLLRRFAAVERYHLLAEELEDLPVWDKHFRRAEEAISQWRSEAEEIFPGYPVVSHLEHYEMFVTEQLSNYEVRHTLIEVRSEDALNELGEIRIGSTDRLLRLRVLRKDGTILEPEHPPGVQDISLTGLAVGDLIESLLVRFPQSLSADFPSYQYEVMRNQIPAKSRTLVLEVPNAIAGDSRFQWVQRGDVPKAEVSSDESTTRWRVQWENVPPLLREPFALREEEQGDISGYVWANELEAWSLFRGALLARKTERSPWFDTAAQQIAGDGPQEQQLTRIFHFVISEIEEDPTSGTALSALSTGKGYRNALLLALCEAVGLPASPVALHLPHLPPPEIPTPRTFGREGIRVQLSDGPRYVFADGDFIAFHAFPPSAEGGYLLDLSLGGQSTKVLETVPEESLAKDGIQTQIELQWEAPDRLEGVAAIFIPAYAAEPVRRGLRQASPKQMVALLEYVFAEAFPGVRVSKVEMPNLAHPGHPLRIGAWLEWSITTTDEPSVRVEPMLSQTIGSRLGLLAPLQAYLRDSERERPLYVAAMSDDIELQIRLPEDAAWLDVPEKISLQAGPLHFSQNAVVNNGTLYWKRRVSAENARIPVSQWPALRESLSGLVGKMAGGLNFWLAHRSSAESAP